MSEITSRAYSSDGRKNWDKAFATSKLMQAIKSIDKKKLAKQAEKDTIDLKTRDEVKPVDTNGNPIKLTNAQKNAIYQKAKDMEAKIRANLCTKDEGDFPSEYNIRKATNEIQMAGMVDRHRNSMKLLGADPKTYNYDSMRKRGGNTVRSFQGVSIKNGKVL